MASARTVHKLYFNLKEPTAFTSAARIAQRIRRPVHEVETVLEDQPSHTLFKKYRRTYPRQATVGIAPGQTLQADLADLQSFRRENDGNGYCLLAVDCYSRTFFATPIKHKTGPEMCAALERIFAAVVARFGHGCSRLVTDEGREFYNKHVRQLLEEQFIAHYSPRSEMKAAMAERGIQTFKSRLYKYMHYKNTHRWVDAVDPIIVGINRTRNRMIGQTPSTVVDGDVDERQRAPSKKLQRPIKSRLVSAGDTVRISKARRVFDKSYLPLWSEELFIVDKVKMQTTPPYAKLKDMNGEDIEGIFYFEEIQKVRDTGLYKVEKVLQRKMVRGKEQLLVRWVGYPPSFDSWIPASNIVML